MSKAERPLSSLDTLKKSAVALRLQKKSLNEIATITGLTPPTIIAAHKRFLAGGWQALNSAERGRPKGTKAIPALDLATLSSKLLEDARSYWDVATVTDWIAGQYQHDFSEKSVYRYLREIDLIPRGETGAATPSSIRSWMKKHRPEFLSAKPVLLICNFRTLHSATGQAAYQIYCRDMKQKLSWTHRQGSLSLSAILDFIDTLLAKHTRPLAVVLKLPDFERFSELNIWKKERESRLQLIPYDALLAAQKTSSVPTSSTKHLHQTTLGKDMPLTHLQRLEAESIQIMREVVAETENPVMLYSIGKDSAVMLHIAMKAFYPSLPPFPLLHVDTRWKFRDMYAFRDKMVKDLGLDLITHINPDGVEKNINPFTHGSAIHTDIMKTEGLKQALNKYGFDAAFGGARRDEEKSRAKERVFSFRSANHRWDPKNQRPEIWKQYNARKHKGETIRVFPLSNWTELDIWQYIYLESIPIVPLYYSAERPVVERDGVLIMVDDERMPLLPGEVPMMKNVRFRTLGCYPLTGAVESDADTLPAIIQEMLLTTTSERQGRVIDHDSAASMEKKKQEGYF